MESRIFEYGGLKVQLWNHPEYKWVTTTKVLSEACGVDRRTLTRAITRHNLADKGGVLIGEGLRTFLPATSQQDTGGAPEKYLWTFDGMMFLGMWLHTPQCEMFRKEVIETIRVQEERGHHSSADVMKELGSLRELVMSMAKVNEYLVAKMAKLETTQEAMLEAANLEASAAGMAMAAAKKTRHLRAVG